MAGWIRGLNSPVSPDDRVVGRALKCGLLAMRGFIRHRTAQSAAALSFATVLALVPLLALVFSALRGFGVYGAVVDGSLRPWIDRTLGMGVEETVPLRDAFHQVLAFGERADMSALGFVGTAILVYLAVSLLIRVEETLNRVFGAPRSRSPARRLADYAAIFFLIPVSIFLATAVGRWADQTLPALAIGVDVFTVFVVCGAVLAVYVVMPQRKVKVRYAASGALFGGVSWYAALHVHAAFQVGVANYSALYAGFAAIPLFLAFLLLSWNLILGGAELAAALDDPRGYAWRIERHVTSPAERRRAAVELVLAVVKAFDAGSGPVPLPSLASAVELQQEEVEELAVVLVQAGDSSRGPRCRR